MPELVDLNLLLKKKKIDNVTLKKLAQVEIEKAGVVFELSITGLG